MTATLLRRGIRYLLLLGIVVAFVLQPKGHRTEVHQRPVVTTYTTTAPHGA
jgi:hypothetical protein